MKKFLILAITFAFLSSCVFAQVTPGSTKSSVAGNFVSSTYANLSDTLSGSGSTSYMVYPVSQFTPNGYYKTGNFVVTLLNLTGTTTTTVTLQHSNDGLNWWSTRSDSTYSSVTSGTYGFQVTDYDDALVRIKTVSSASGTTKITGTYVLRREIVTQQ